MKKRFLKTLGTCILAGMIMASAMAVTASAEGTNCEVTVSSANKKVAGTFKVYKVATATKTGSAYSYAYTDAFKSFAADYPLETTVAGYSDNSNVEDISASSDIQKYADKLAKAVTTSTTPVETGSIGGTATLEPGYYLVTIDTTDAGVIGAPSLIVVTEEEEKTVNAKSSKITFEKKITAISEGGTISQGEGNPSDTGVGEIGATVSYSLETQFPNYAEDVKSIEDFTITDTPSKGITYNKNNANMQVYVDNSQITKGYTVEDNGDGFIITFDDKTVTDNGGKNVKVTFNATINNSAVIGADNEGKGNPNKAELKYGNQYATGQGEAKIPDEVKVYTTKITINKTKEDGKTSLTGAGFTIYEADPTKTTGKGKAIKTIESTADVPLSTFEFVGLDEGTYIIEETQVPDGYKKADDITVTVGAKKETTGELAGEFGGKFTDVNDTVVEYYSRSVKNIQGKTLPGTGGIGTTIFTVAGVTMIAGAGALLTVYMRKRRKDEE